MAKCKLNDTIEYKDAEEMGDRHRDDWRQYLANRNLTTYDTAGEFTIGWLYAANGSRLSQDSDDIFSDDQPPTSHHQP